MGKYFEKIFKIITNILLFIVIVATFLVLYGSYQKDVLKKSYINYFGYTFFEVVSGSMSGTIEINDLVIVKLQDYDIQENDIITYQSGKEFITHRVIKVNEDNLITKGDNNDSSDKPIAKSDVLGKVVKVIPSFGIWREVIFTPKVLISIAISFILFSVYLGIKDYNKNKKNCEKLEI